MTIRQIIVLLLTLLGAYMAYRTAENGKPLWPAVFLVALAVIASVFLP